MAQIPSRNLTGQLADQATPEAARQLIGFLEQQQTELDKELKALPPHEKKADMGHTTHDLTEPCALPGFFVDD
jgi:hypothetical protein